jgi:hypothetical protein
MTAKYKEVNNFFTLKSLYKRIQNDEKTREIEEIYEIKTGVIRALKKKNTNEAILKVKITDIENKVQEKVSKIIKSELRKNRRFLETEKLSESEMQTIKMLDFNPNILLVLDDITPYVKTIAKSEVFQNILYAGRHNSITMIISLHSDTAFPPSFRTNTNNTFFADKQTASKYYEKLRTQSSKEEVKLVKEYISLIKTKNEGGHCKLAYLSDTGKFYLYTAEICVPFTFGSSSVKDYNEKIKSDGISVSKNNPFYKNFKV